MTRTSPQLPLRIRTWGGKRKGAGRKPKGERAGVSHRPRPELGRRLPVHVTLRMADHVWSLRSRRCFRVIEEALYRGAERFAVCLVKFSVQGNHIHLLVEADDRRALSRAVQGLSIRLARGLNRLMQRRGRVLADRFHSRVLRTPTEVRHCIHYIKNNHQHHGLFSAAIDPYCSDSPTLRFTLPSPSSWLLRAGWTKGKNKKEGPPPP